MVLALATAALGAEEWTVGPGEDFETLADAVDGTVSGDILNLTGGSHEALDLVIDHTLALNGQFDGSTLIYGLGSIDAAFTIEGENTTVTFDSIGLDQARIVVNEANLTLLYVNMTEGYAAGDGGCLLARDAIVSAESTTFSGCTATGYGGAIRLDASDLEMRSSEVVDSSGLLAGGISASGSWLAIHESQFSGNTNQDSWSHDLWVENVAPEEVGLYSSGFAGGLHVNSTHIEVAACSFHWDTELSGGQIQVFDSVFSMARLVASGRSVEVGRSLWCHGARSSPMLDMDAEYAARIANTTFVGGIDAGPAVSLETGDWGEVAHNAFVGNATFPSQALNADGGWVGVVRNNLFSHHPGPPETMFLGSYWNADHNLFYDDGLTGPLGSDPVIATYDPYPDVDPSDSGCIGTPIPHGEQFDAGNPASPADPDGSVADIGPMGGPDANTFFWETDADGDGAPVARDCDDSNPDRSPDLPADWCDGVDNDCDGVAQDDASDTTVWYEDLDGDGFGTDAEVGVGCNRPANAAPRNGDCDDTLSTGPAIGPARVDACNGIDDDCDGDTDDEGDDFPWRLDADGDGWPDGTDVEWDCVAPGPGWVADTTLDCAGMDPDRHPEAEELCNGLDDDCDGSIDEDAGDIWFLDSDGDGFGTPLNAPRACERHPGWLPPSDVEDCDDSNSNVHPGTLDSCGVGDEDCDGTTDEDGFAYRDADGDGFGDASDFVACDEGIEIGGDCDDLDETVNPDADDVCNGRDDDCDGDVDSGFTTRDYAADEDADGWTHGGTVRACAAPPGMAPINEFDCDDENALVHLGGEELCDGLDNDCDDEIDDGWPTDVEFLVDHDGDGFGGPREGCVAPPDAIGGPADCHDSDPNVHPGAGEICNGADDDCDGIPDEGLDGDSVIYGDEDGDGHPGTAYVACSPPAYPFTTYADDCRDHNPNVHPGQEEVCNGLDDDCDGLWDEVPAPTQWRDDDGDGWGDPGRSSAWCGGRHGYVDQPGDCDDTWFSVNPDADENCNGRDDDCNGLIDDGHPLVPWYEDEDEDGYGGAVTWACAAPKGHVDVDGDCDDSHSDVYPGADDPCDDGTDQDCDGVDPRCIADDEDGDGYCSAVSCTNGAVPGDCDEGEPLVHPGAAEACNETDDDCDAEIDEGLDTDDDDDGHTTAGSCAGTRDDCDDSLPGVHPGATETCNGLDDDCDLVEDDGLTTDLDHDAYPAEDCEGTPVDCDDADPTRHPGAADPTNGIDEDCDGGDDGTEWVDDDGDGYCESSPCADGSAAGDCDDGDPTVHPDAIELPNGLDDDCDGTVDDPSVDLDGDGFSTFDGDCVEGDPNVFPGAEEACNGRDDDCDGYIGLDEWDADLDGWWGCAGDCAPFDPTVHPWRVEDCSDGLDNDCNGRIDADLDVDGDGWTDCDGDCNDDEPTAFPGAEDVCNGNDDDCDGWVDEAFDRDRDLSLACSCAGEPCDCDDENARVHPSRTEVCGDGIDNDCDGSVDQDVDLDQDGWGPCDGDCDNTSPYVHPRAAETCDLVDNDCDGLVDEASDRDEDGVPICAGDCDDSEPSVHLGAVERCDERDNDCNGVVDDTECASPPPEQEALEPDSDAGGPSGCFCNGGSNTPAGWGFALVLLACRRRGAGAVLAAAIPCAAMSTASAADLRVGSDEPYTTVAGALAVAEDGDRILLTEDVTEDVLVDRSVTIASELPPNPVVLWGAETAESVVTIAPGVEAAFTDLTIDARFHQRALRSEGATVVLHSVNLRHGSAPDGASLLASDSVVVADNVSMRDSLPVLGDGGHVWALRSDLTLSNVEVIAGTATRGGGLYALDCDVTLLGVIFEDGSAEEAGGAWLEGGTLEADGAIWTRNTAYREPTDVRIEGIDGFTFDTMEWEALDPASPVPALIVRETIGGRILHHSFGSARISVEWAEAVEIGTSTMCGSDVSPQLEVLDSHQIWVHNVLFAESPTNPGPRLEAYDSRVHLDFDTFVGPAPSPIYAETSALYVRNSVFWNFTEQGNTDTVVEALRNAYFDAEPLSGTSYADIVTSGTSPFFSYSADGDCTNDVLLPFPVLHRAFPGFENPDGTPGDLGFTGGPNDIAVHWDDTDEDGWPAVYDCNDGDALVFPFAGDQCNGLDHDCDGVEDNGSDRFWYEDGDGDGFGTGTGVLSCGAVIGATTVLDGDCDDSDPDRSPGHADVCNGINDDCAGGVDDDADHWPLWAPDSDGDGYGSITEIVQDCEAPPDTVANLGDCDDDQSYLNPGHVASEYCGGEDYDCDGLVRQQRWRDRDGDGYGGGPVAHSCDWPELTWLGEDCDDAVNTVHPYATETCDGTDEDCDEVVDDAELWFLDADGDGHGGGAGTSRCALVDLEGYTLVDDDCDDSDELAYEGATELCNDVDDNCNGYVDENYILSAWYADHDGDGFAGGDARLDCGGLPDESMVSEDCDDEDPLVHPDAEETCNGIDADCNGDVDHPEHSAPPAWYRDQDGDGYGVLDDDQYLGCDPPSEDYVLQSGDCDDTDATKYAGATELCNGLDDDCDGLPDDGIDVKESFLDADGDGYGTGVSGWFCKRPEGWVKSGNDCDDNDASAHPDAADPCGDGVDGDCDGMDPTCLGVDTDQDGYCDRELCEGGALPGDCNDANPAVHPDAAEACNDSDDDCDSKVDEGLSPDVDHDGHTVPGSCKGPDDDCDDALAGVHPGADEVCNGLDDDCDADLDEDLYVDVDGDGFRLGACLGGRPADCDDADATVYPGQNCPGPVIAWDPDSDADQDGYSANQGDCDDGDDAVHPAAAERCNGLDDDCDGILDPLEADADGDRVRICDDPGDCDDLDPMRWPGLAEDCEDGIDNDCDGVADNDDDLDEDGHTTCGGDCADDDPARNPSASEICNDEDDDCDGSVDEGFDRDNDDVRTCVDCADVEPDCDCNDFSAVVSPRLSEDCGDGIDNDCDGSVDVAEDRDLDGVDTCSGDCDDQDPLTGPGAPERCNFDDDDCDGWVDEASDADEDGVSTCAGDCDDDDALVHLGADESCDGIDNDCDRLADEGIPDLDSDGAVACFDCDDDDALAHPGAIDECNGIDDDCDGADDGCDTGDGEAPGPRAPPDVCGCSQPTGAAIAWFAVLAAGLATRRRRRATATTGPDRPWRGTSRSSRSTHTHRGRA